MANPTTPGPHNHLGSRPAPRDPATEHRLIDKVFGVDAPIIETLPIEIGSGCMPVEWQLAEHVLRVFVAGGRDPSRALVLKLLSNKTIDQQKLAAELTARNLMSEKTAAAKRTLDQFTPAGSPN
jgi:hypothetical protein